MSRTSTQQIDSVGAHDWEFLQVGDQSYLLAVANYTQGGSYSTISRIYSFE